MYHKRFFRHGREEMVQSALHKEIRVEYNFTLMVAKNKMDRTLSFKTKEVKDIDYTLENNNLLKRIDELKGQTSKKGVEFEKTTEIVNGEPQRKRVRTSSTERM